MKTEIRCNDNLEELKKIPDESVDLVYIDPPFNTGKHRGDYDDNFGSLEIYDRFLRPRIKELQRVLKQNGSVYVHVDTNVSKNIGILLDDIFGEHNQKNVITWKRQSAHPISTRNFDNISDHILFYTKGNEYPFNPQYTESDESSFNKREKETGRKFKDQPLIKGVMGKNSIKELNFNGKKVTLKGNKGFSWTQDTLNKRLEENPHVIYWTKNGNPRYKVYLDDHKGNMVSNIWDDIYPVNSQAKERLNYSTQKPEKLLERIINSSSNEGDTVLDAFAGSGTACAVAKKLGRKSICIDQNPKACKIMEERLK